MDDNIDDEIDGLDAAEQISDILPALPGEKLIAALGHGLYQILPDGAREFVEQNLSLRKPTMHNATASANAPDQPAISPKEEREMAKPPLRLPGATGRAEKAAGAAKPAMSKLDKAKLAAGAVGTAGTAAWGLDELLSFAQEHYPEAYGIVSGMFADQGIDVESDQVKQGTGNTRANVLAAFARSGVDASFVKNVGLTAGEQMGMLNLINQYEAQMITKVDGEQTARISTGDQVLDRDIMVLEHARVCEMLGLTGPRRIKDLYLIVRTINTMTEKHVDAFEQYERIFGRARSRGTV